MVCGCGQDNICHYCNSNEFIGFDIKYNSNWNWDQAWPVNGLTVAPQSNGLTCSTDSEYVDVKFSKI